MVAITKSTSLSNTPSPVAEPAAKDQCAKRVQLIALSLIAIVAAFILLPIKYAIIMTAVVVVGSISVMCTQDSTAKARYTPPSKDGRIGNVFFYSAEDARRFQVVCNERFSEHLECLDSGVIDLSKIIHYKSNVDADTRARITEEIQSLIR